MLAAELRQCHHCFPLLQYSPQVPDCDSVVPGHCRSHQWFHMCGAHYHQLSHLQADNLGHLSAAQAER